MGTELKQMDKRIEWVDIGKYICIMFVMLSHLESGTEVLRRFYTPFFLTVFFFLSGYVYRLPVSFKEHMIKKGKGLLVPWMIFSNVNILLSMIVTFKGERNFKTEFLWNLLQIRGHGDGIWFVAALFVAFIPFYFIVRWGNSGKPVKTIVLAFGLSLLSVIYMHILPKDTFPWGDAALPWHLEYMFQAMFWMVLGYYFRTGVLKSGTVEMVFDRWNTAAHRAVLWSCYLIVAYIPNIIGGDILFSYIRSILGILAIVSVCKVLKSNNYVKFVGANTLTYFALHGKLYAVIEKVLGRFGVYGKLLGNEITSSIVAVVITMVMSVVLILPAMIINRWFPWVLGRKKRK